MLTAGAHALRSVSGTKTASYCYDANGNMLSGDGRIVTWSAFDMATRIERGINVATFDYGPDRARYRRVDISGTGITTTLYVGGKAMERIARPDGTVEFKHYIGDVAVVTTAGTQRSVNYLHRDHLGSVDAITDHTGAVVQRMSFDAWGKRRETAWTALTTPAIALFDTRLTTRGFTGHEMIDPVGLVHMNGRIYDPEVGRFLSADPHVQDLSNLQSWNRYSYVLNNPLSYTDPSGFFFSKLFRAIGNFFSSVFRAIGNVFKSILRSPIFRALVQIVGCGLPGVNLISCAAVSAVISLTSGGSVLDALQSFAFSFAQLGVFSQISDATFALTQALGTIVQVVKAGVHGVIGGALSIAQGGSFLQGFAGSAAGALGGALAGESGLFGEYRDGNAGNTIARALVSGAAGCAGAVATGSKCAQAAVTAAFASLYNGDSSDLWRGLYREREQHRLGVMEAIEQYKAAGYGILYAGEKWVDVPGFDTERRYDFIAIDADGKNVGVEVKTTILGIIELKPDQVAKDVVVATQGGTIRVGGQSVTAVGYSAQCFGCQLIDFRSQRLMDIIYANGLGVSGCRNTGNCTTK